MYRSTLTGLVSVVQINTSVTCFDSDIVDAGDNEIIFSPRSFVSLAL